MEQIGRRRIAYELDIRKAKPEAIDMEKFLTKMNYDRKAAFTGF